MTEVVLKAVAAYLLGSVVGSLVVGRLRGGVDIRTVGSGNAGGTNALRTQGAAFAAWVMLIDVGKGWLATRVLASMPLPNLAPLAAQWRDWTVVLCGAAVILGHVYPLWYGFRGGKGAATLVGTLLGISPVLLGAVLLTWLLVVALTGFVSLASMTAAAALPLYVVWIGSPAQHVPLLAFGIFVAVLVAFTHRANIARLRAGEEHRARRLWLFGRRH